MCSPGNMPNITCTTGMLPNQCFRSKPDRSHLNHWNDLTATLSGWYISCKVHLMSTVSNIFFRFKVVINFTTFVLTNELCDLHRENNLILGFPSLNVNPYVKCRQPKINKLGGNFGPMHEAPLLTALTGRSYRYMLRS